MRLTFVETSQSSKGMQDIRKMFGGSSKSDNNAKPMGSVLGGSSSAKLPTGNIVRKLPGFGVITNERPTSQVKKKVTFCNEDQDDPNDDVILYSPDAEPRKISETIKKRKTKEKESRANESVVSVLDSDSDDEFNSRLANMRAQRKSAKKLNNTQSSASLRQPDASPVGTTKTIRNFVSVSNPRSPEFSNLTKNRRNVSSDESDVVERRLFDFSRDRNKRAIELSDDDVTTAPAMPTAKKPKTGTNSGAGPSSQSSVVIVDDDVRGAASAKIVECPACGTKCLESFINAHLDVCLS